ncbi:MAG: M48 family metallopeptidase [Acidobacteriota bacterium]|nr:M48 family metallopeptidase [Acidobacteriota bacterium]
MKFVTLGLAGLCMCALLMAVPAGAQAEQPSAPAQAQTAQVPQSENGDVYQLPPDKLQKAIVLGRIRTALDIGGSLWGLLVLWLILRLRFAAKLAAWSESKLKRRWMQGLLFFAMLLLILTALGWPLDATGHAVSVHFGISVQSWPSWMVDQLKALGLTVVFGSLVLLLFNWVVRKSPKRYWLWLWVVTLPLLVLSIFVEPLLEPMFNKFEPLSAHHEELVQKLEEVVQRTGTNIPPDRMFLMKASEKTNGLNAYVSGIGATKRIVVWDTTAGRVPDDVVMFVFGHESGHYVLHHIPKMLAISSITLFFAYWICAWAAERLIRRNGACWGMTAVSERAGFVVLLFTLSVLGFATQPVSNAISRYFEHQADVYGQEAIHGLVPDPQATAVRGFNALGAAWLEDPNPGKLVEIWEYNHPTVQERAKFAAHYDPWKDGGHREFFKK